MLVLACRWQLSLVPELYQWYSSRMKRNSRRPVGAGEARKRLPALLDRAAQGEMTVISKRGRPYAALIALDQVPREHSRDLIVSLKGSGRGLFGRNPRRFVGRLRAEWR
jgi:prevent-host-death family protein